MYLVIFKTNIQPTTSQFISIKDYKSLRLQDHYSQTLDLKSQTTLLMGTESVHEKDYLSLTTI